jgi:DNA-binding FrmR family transcriptional regulator
VQAAIGKVGEVVLRSHVETCVTDAIRNDDERECKRTVEELVAVFGRYRRIREQSP